MTPQEQTIATYIGRRLNQSDVLVVYYESRLTDLYIEYEYNDNGTIIATDYNIDLFGLMQDYIHLTAK